MVDLCVEEWNCRANFSESFATCSHGVNVGREEWSCSVIVLTKKEYSVSTRPDIIDIMQTLTAVPWLILPLSVLWRPALSYLPKGMATSKGPPDVAIPTQFSVLFLRKFSYIVLKSFTLGLPLCLVLLTSFLNILVIICSSPILFSCQNHHRLLQPLLQKDLGLIMMLHFLPTVSV